LDRGTGWAVEYWTCALIAADAMIAADTLSRSISSSDCQMPYVHH
jgi:hypothetical protein